MANYGKYPFISLDTAKEFLSVNSNTEDAKLSNTISYGCSIVEHFIGYEVLSNTYTETFDGGTSALFVPRLPLNNVYSVAEYDGSNYTELNPPTSIGSLVNQDQLIHQIEVKGNTHLRTRHKKFGKSSVYMDGSTQSDYLSLANSDDWYLDDDDFTIEGNFRTESYSTNQTLISQVEDANNYWKLLYDSSLGLTFTALRAGTEVANINHAATTGYTANTFTNFSIVRNVNAFTLYRDGVQLATETHANTLPDLSGPLEFGRSSITSSEEYFTGNMDEVRITHSSIYDAAYTVVDYPYVPDNDTKLLMHFNGANSSVSITDSHATEQQYIFDNDTGEICRECTTAELTLQGPRTFNNYNNGIKITYVAGWDTDDVPQDLRYATLEMIKIIHKEKADMASMSFQGETATPIHSSSNMPIHIKRVLDLYRII